MAKRTQTIRRSVFDHFVGMAPKGLRVDHTNLHWLLSLYIKLSLALEVCTFA